MSQTTLSGGGRSPFVQGAIDIIPVMIATVPFGMVFGALAVKNSLSTGEAVLMSGALYAGASQFVALQFWANPLPFWTILASVLAVNLRHVLYGAALGRKMTEWTALERYFGFALLVDPTFALADLKSGPRLNAGYYWGLAVPLYVNWVLATWLGAVFGSLIERPERYGIDFVVTAYFIHLVVGFRKRPNALPVIAASVAGSLAAYLAFGPPWHFAGGAAAGMCVAAAMASPRKVPG